MRIIFQNVQQIDRRVGEYSASTVAISAKVVHVFRVVLAPRRIGNDPVAPQDRFDPVRLHEKGDLPPADVRRADD